MSVLIPDVEVYEYIHAGLQRTAYNSTCDEFYAYNIARHFKETDLETESLRLVKSWQTLNIRSYNARYKDTGNRIERVSRTKLFALCPFQLLMFIRCAIYNIEIETIRSTGAEVSLRDTEDLKILEEWEVSMMRSIIDQIPTYKNSQWSSYTPPKDESKKLFPHL
jgi:hypothetical protein